MKKILAIFSLVIILVSCTVFDCSMAESGYKLLVLLVHNNGLLYSGKFNVDVYLNDAKITTLKPGDEFSKMFTVSNGPNTLSFYRAGSNKDPEKYDFDLVENSRVGVTVFTNHDKVELKDPWLEINPLLGNVENNGPLEIQEGEITFRNIPWGSSFKTASKEFANAKSSMGKLDGNFLTSYGNMIRDLHEVVAWFPSINTERDELGMCGVVKYPEVQVAGYDLERIKLFFAYLTNEFGEVRRTEKYTALFAAMYNISVPGGEYDSTISDLKTKLVGLYGDLKTTYDGKKNGYGTKAYIWEGTNSTYVCLCDSLNEGFFSSTRDIFILYASTKYERKMKDLDDLISLIDKVNSTKAPFEIDDNNGL